MPLVTAVTITYASRTRSVLHTFTKVFLHPTIVGTMPTIVVTLWPHHRAGHGCRLHLAIARSLCYMLVPSVFMCARQCVCTCSDLYQLTVTISVSAPLFLLAAPFTVFSHCSPVSTGGRSGSYHYGGAVCTPQWPALFLDTGRAYRSKYVRAGRRSQRWGGSCYPTPSHAISPSGRP